MGFLMSGPGCCCGSCELLFEDQFTRANNTDLGSDYTEPTAGWSILSNQLSSATVNAKMLTVETFPPQFVATFDHFTVPVGTRTSSFRFIFGYEDDNNYWFALFENSYVTIFSNVLNGSVSFWRVSGGGSPVQFGRTWTYTEDGTIATEAFICVTPTVATWANSSGLFSGKLYSYPLPAALPVAGKMGFELRALTGTRLDIDDLRIGRHADQEGEPLVLPNITDTCECPVYCAACQSAAFPDQWQVVIAGMTGAYSGCNGTYVLPGKACVGTLSFASCGFLINSMRFEITGTGPFTIAVQFENGLNGVSRVRYETTFSTTQDCLNFDIEVPRVSGVVESVGSTATVTNA